MKTTGTVALEIRNGEWEPCRKKVAKKIHSAVSNLQFSNLNEFYLSKVSGFFFPHHSIA